MNARDTTPLLAAALNQALRQLNNQLLRFADSFPGDTSIEQRYQPRALPGHAAGANAGWTSGFWTGQLWQAYALTGQSHYRDAALIQLASFEQRLRDDIDLQHHDLGFLYQLTCVAADRLLDLAPARDMAMRAAERLLARFLPGAGVIQSWGPIGDIEQGGRVIIDGAMNLPLLHWASQVSGRPEFRAAARSHLERSLPHLVRADGASYHTFHFDPASGAPRHASTHQGLDDDSCWARGQAWGIYGLSLNHRHLPDMGLLAKAMRMADYFLAHLPPDGLCLWDLKLAYDSGEPRDSSATAIAVCGLLDIAAQLPPGAAHAHYHGQALRLLHALAAHCAARQPQDGLLGQGVYHRLADLGVNEATLWGDYYYLEALARVCHELAPFGA